MRRPLRSDEARSVANLAIDLGDPGRMARARRMHRANAVAEVEISDGAARATVTDAEGEIHDVEIAIGAPPMVGDSPVATDLETDCTCDDEGEACTHALASLLGIAEEIEANGRLLDIWTGNSSASVAGAGAMPLAAHGGPFFRGAWPDHAAPVRLDQIRFEERSTLVVDDVDAGPVFRDAATAVRAGLRRYRARS